MRPLRITAKYKTVTPMITAGADPQRFELRAPTVKSGLRFWWRAFQPLEGRALFRAEAALFGSTKGAAPFHMSLRVRPETVRLWSPGDGVGRDWGGGLAYVFFPVFAPPSKKKGTPARIKSVEQSGRPVAKPGLEFEMRFLFRPDAPEGLAGDLVCALWLLENLGGLGGRTRRGAGCFTLTHIQVDGEFADTDAEPFGLFSRQGISAPGSFLARGLKFIRERWGNTEIHDSLPPHTAFREGVSGVWVLDEPAEGRGEGAMKALDAIGIGMKTFRNTNPHDEAREMHTALTSHGYRPGIRVLKKAEFGLPVIYNFRSHFGGFGAPASYLKYEAKGVAFKASENQPGKNETTERRASPLLISCHEFGGIPYAVACHLPAPILPEGHRIWLKSQGGNNDHFPKAPTEFPFTHQLLLGGAKVNG
ncbi:MAG: RAMP superfamily CRISPR-associated protein, partial [Desulfococcaceae bacterium]